MTTSSKKKQLSISMNIIKAIFTFHLQQIKFKIYSKSSIKHPPKWAEANLSTEVTQSNT